MKWLADRVDIGHPNGCWLWTGTTSNGYGQYGGDLARTLGTRIAHRIVYQTLVGPIPNGLDLDHLCRVRRCVNPDHVEPVTRSENLRRSPIVGKYWAEQTHCVNGHELTGYNAYERPDRSNRRQCRTCAVEATRRWRERNAA